MKLQKDILQKNLCLFQEIRLANGKTKSSPLISSRLLSSYITNNDSSCILSCSRSPFIIQVILRLTSSTTNNIASNNQDLHGNSSLHAIQHHPTSSRICNSKISTITLENSLITPKELIIQLMNENNSSSPSSETSNENQNLQNYYGVFLSKEQRWLDSNLSFLENQVYERSLLDVKIKPERMQVIYTDLSSSSSSSPFAGSSSSPSVSSSKKSKKPILISIDIDYTLPINDIIFSQLLGTIHCNRRDVIEVRILEGLANPSEFDEEEEEIDIDIENDDENDDTDPNDEENTNHDQTITPNSPSLEVLSKLKSRKFSSETVVGFIQNSGNSIPTITMDELDSNDNPSDHENNNKNPSNHEEEIKNETNEENQQEDEEKQEQEEQEEQGGGGEQNHDENEEKKLIKQNSTIIDKKSKLTRVNTWKFHSRSGKILKKEESLAMQGIHPGEYRLYIYRLSIGNNQSKINSDMDTNIWESQSENDIIITINQENKKIVTGGTLNKLIEYLTINARTDQTFLTTFMLTYPIFTTSEMVFKKFLQRFQVPKPVDLDHKEFVNTRQLPIRLRVVSAMKHWIEHCGASFDRDLLNSIQMFITNCVDQEGLPQVGSILRTSVKKVQSGITVTKGKQVNSLPSNPPSSSALNRLPKKEITSLKFTDFADEEIAKQLSLIAHKLFCSIKVSFYFCVFLTCIYLFLLF